MCLIFIFLVTSADSGTFVISMMTTNGNLNPAVRVKLIWGLIIAAITVGTLATGSVSVAKAWRSPAPFRSAFIIILQMAGFVRMIREDPMIRRPQTIVHDTDDVSPEGTAREENSHVEQSIVCLNAVLLGVLLAVVPIRSKTLRVGSKPFSESMIWPR